ncbi:glycosyltransferase family 4 protein [Methanothermococcus okinawensis]|uniref:Glycosyl transferase group 1 n=1 Tax=Methanothermococcus okinawensis (strain DSM 14208 / JCM 11175 / IH1) TaxID=647113 RepID=F8AMK2_METOI|nr:glycosyltransferase family 4 protein [Methanothermococcus okinawensis]AEH06042.1 glycosyl transferase group 1 [Methanothermococcus okinawensis IH1]
MKNILLITNELNTTNGWATVGYHLNKELNNEYNVIVLSQNTDKNNKCNLITSNHYYNFYRLLKDYSTIKNSLHNKNFDLIICNIEPFLPLAVLLKKYFNSKLILFGFGTYIYYPFVKFPYKYYNKFWIKYVDKIIVPSKFTYNKVRVWYKKDNLFIVKLGVNIDEYHPVNIKKEKAFVFVGAQKERKGVTYLILAFDKLVKEYPDVKLYMVGKKSEKYYNFVKNHNLHENIIFTGEVNHNELLEYYSKSFAHVLPSINTKNAFEGFGLVHLEANACGIPSIGSLGTANEEVIVDEYNGFLCPQKDVKCLYERMKTLLEDKQLYSKMCKNSLKYAKEHTWGKTAENFKRIMGELE